MIGSGLRNMPMNAVESNSRETVTLPTRARPLPTQPPDEQKLLQRARRGDMDAYGELVRRYQERIYTTIYHMTSNHEDAHDLAQESFIKAFQALKSFKGDSSFFTWVYRIAVNKTINFLTAT